MKRLLVVMCLSSCSQPSAPEQKTVYSRAQSTDERMRVVGDLTRQCCDTGKPAACDEWGRALREEGDPAVIDLALMVAPACISRIVDRVPVALTRKPLNKGTHERVIDLISLQRPTQEIVSHLLEYVDGADASTSDAAIYKMSFMGERELASLVPRLRATDAKVRGRTATIFLRSMMQGRLEIPILETALFDSASSHRDQLGDMALIVLHDMPDVEANLDALERAEPEDAARLLGVREATCGQRGDRMLAKLAESTDARVRYAATLSTKLRAERCK